LATVQNWNTQFEASWITISGWRAKKILLVIAVMLSSTATAQNKNGAM